MEKSFSVSGANGLFVHLYLSESPVNDPSHEMGGKNHHCPQSTTRTEGLHTMECGLVPQGDRLQHCYHYPVGRVT